MAKEAAEQAEAVNRFFNDEVLATANFRSAAGRNVTVVSMRPSVRAPGSEYSGGAGAVARLGLTLGQSYYGLDLLVPAWERLSRSLEYSVAHVGPDELITNQLRIELAEVAWERDLFDDAERLYHEAIASSGRNDDQRSLAGDALSSLGWVAFLRGKHLDSASLLEKLIDNLERETAPDPYVLAYAQWNLAETYVEMNRFEEARALVKHAKAYFETAGYSDSMLAWVLTTDLFLLVARGHLDEALVLARANSQSILGELSEGHAIALVARQYESYVLLLQGRASTARPILEDTLRRHRQRDGDAHTWTLSVNRMLALAHLVENQPDQALAVIEPAHRTSADHPGAAHPLTLSIARVMADAWLQSGRRSEAEALLEASIASATKVLPEGHLTLTDLHMAAGRAQHLAGNTEPAVQAYRRAATIYAAALGGEHPYTVSATAAAERLKLPAPSLH